MRQRLCLVTAAALACAPLSARAQPTPESTVAAGIRQVQQGDFEGAVVTLEAATGRLAGQPGREPLLLQACLHLGVALVALDQPDAARARFRQALDIDPRLRLTPERFSPKVIAVFEQARREAKAARPSSGGATKALIIAGAGAGAAVGTAVALKGKEEATINDARFAGAVILCPDGVEDHGLPFSVLVDATAGSSQALTVSSVNVEMRVVSSPGLPSEVGFVSDRQSRTVPDRLAAGTRAMLVIESTLLCGNGPGGPARYNEWTALVTLVTSAGTFRAGTADRLRVELP